jgi:hypothetical protein
MTKAALEGLNDDTRLTRCKRLHLHHARLQEFSYKRLHRKHLPACGAGLTDNDYFE